MPLIYSSKSSPVIDLDGVMLQTLFGNLDLIAILSAPGFDTPVSATFFLLYPEQQTENYQSQKQQQKAIVNLLT